MHTDSLLGSTVRDLVLLVQDSGCQAVAAETQLLASHAALIRSAARSYPSVPQAAKVAREAFLVAVRDFRISTNISVASYCWSAMGSALKAASAAKMQPQQLPLIVEPVPVPVNLADLQLRACIAAAQINKRANNVTNFGLSA